MLREEEDDDGKNRLPGIARKRYLRSVSWTDRSPTRPVSAASNPRPPQNRAARSFLPPLSITRRKADEWPRAGSDDLGVWPNPQTPRGSVAAAENLNSSSGSGKVVVGGEREFEFKRDKLAFFDKECSRVADHIYLGSDAVAKNRDVLRQNGITHVLNCVGFVCPEYFKLDLVYKTLWLQDTPSEDITSVLYDVFDYFEDVREQGGRVFVHCCQGVSRSTSLVIAYLMWREGQSFEEAFQRVKAARGVTNPNVGFACQLLQCQKRVHAAPASPSSALRVYRMAPHSPYDPLHLVPKTVGVPGVQALDSRGAFVVVVHSPSALYVWHGKRCGAVMSRDARAAAFQVVRYEKAKGLVVDVYEGEESPEFWEALGGGGAGHHERKVGNYDLDFEVFCKAVAGGVVPPFSVLNVTSETCLPARENGWSRLRRKFSIGLMREFMKSSLTETDCDNDEEIPVSPPVSPPGSTEFCGSPDSFECFPNGSPDRVRESFSCFQDRSPKFGSKSPTLSPSTSDYASSFSFSPSSSNWSDLSGLSSQQPSPSGMDSFDPFPIKNMSLSDSPSNFLTKESPPTSPEECYTSDRDFWTRKGINTRSLAERRGSIPPPRMMIASVDEESARVPRNFGRSWSFTVGDVDDDETKYSVRSEYKTLEKTEGQKGDEIDYFQVE